MRITLDIDDSILSAVKELARRQGRTIGEVISALARQALVQPQGPQAVAVIETPGAHGFRPLPAGGRLVSNQLVDKLRGEQGI